MRESEKKISIIEKERCCRCCCKKICIYRWFVYYTLLCMILGIYFNVSQYFQKDDLYEEYDKETADFLWNVTLNI